MPDAADPRDPTDDPRDESSDDPGDLTSLLRLASGGDVEAFDRAFSRVYDELHRLAQRVRGGRASDTMGATALVHEAYLKLAPAAQPKWEGKRHFLRVAARAMRQVLVDHARRFRAQKRGGGVAHLDLDDANVAVEERADMLVALDESLARLAELNPRLAQVVEMRFFGGLTEEETAAALGVTDRTVRRDWVKARAWLHGDMAAHGSASVS